MHLGNGHGQPWGRGMTFVWWVLDSLPIDSIKVELLYQLLGFLCSPIENGTLVMKTFSEKSFALIH